MLTLKELWLDKTPYGNGSVSWKHEIEFIKEHGPILLTGVHAVLFHNLKWIRRIVKAGVFIATRETEQIEQVEKPKQLPPPKQPTSI